MRLFKKIEEGESWTSAVLGYKWVVYRALNDEETWALRVGIYLGFVLIKIEFIRP